MIQTVENIGEKLVSMLTYDASQPLIFSSGLFLFLFAGFLFFYGFTRRAPMARIVYVILFSLYFYYKSSGIYFLLLVFASVSDYWIAHAIYKVRTQRAKYWLVGLSVLVNLGMLGYFKYTNFLIEIANNLFGQGFLNFQNIFLPVGISFFVFQSMSFQKSLVHFGTECDDSADFCRLPNFIQCRKCRLGDHLRQKQNVESTSMGGGFDSF